MPQAVVAVSVWIFGPALGTTVAGFLLSSTFLTYAAVYAASYVYGAVFAKKPPTSGMGDAAGRQQIVRSSTSPRNLIYGDVVTSGTLAFAATTDRYTDDKIHRNGYLHMVILLAAHEVDAIGEVYLNEEPVGALDANGFVTEGKYRKDRSETVKISVNYTAGSQWVDLDEVPARIVSLIEPGAAYPSTSAVAVGYTLIGSRLYIPSTNANRTFKLTFEKKSADSLVRIRKFLGTNAQQADPDLVAAMKGDRWTNDHRLAGIAYLYIRLEWDADTFETGIPNIKAQVRGRKVLDPRTSTTGYSANWALCVFDYLRHPEGFGLAIDDIDTASVIAAANISDEFVDSLQPKRYELHGVCYADNAPDDNLKQMMSAAGGSVVLSGGIMRVHAAAYDVPTVTLTADDLRGTIKVQARTPRKELFNAVKGTYVNGTGTDPTWQPVDFPPVTNSFYQGQDGGTQIVRDIELPFTKDGLVAQRLAKLTLDRARQGITVEFPAKLSAMKLKAWDTVNVTMPKFGWVAKTFRVMEWKLSSDGGIDLVLREEAAAAYQWNGGQPLLFDPARDTSLPIPGVVPALENVQAASGAANLVMQADGTIVPRIRLSWDLTQAVLLSGSGTVQIEVQLADDDEDVWTRLPGLPGDSTFGFVGPVIEGRAYLLRARLVSRRGVAGPWSYAAPHIVVGKSAPPTDVPWFIIDGDRLAWGGIDDVDLAGYRIRFHYGSNASWSDAAPLHAGLLTSSPYTPPTRPQGDVTLMIKAVDTSGNESANVTLISSSFAAIPIGNVVEVFDMQARGYAATFLTD